MTNVAIITARGGSKRIPKKNIKDFCGRPIIEYSIDAAQKSGVFDEVMVSTDDQDIAKLAVSLGAKVPFMRSIYTSGDYSTTAEVIKEVLEEYRKTGIFFDFFCCLYPTAPFVTATKLADAMGRLISSEAKSLIPVVKFSFPPQRALQVETGKINVKWPQNINMRSQDLEPLYHDCGQFYCMKSSEFEKEGNLITDNTLPFILPESEAQDIDTEEDWKLAEIKYKRITGVWD